MPGRLRSLVALFAALLLVSCQDPAGGSSGAPPPAGEVVIYASVDQNYAEPVLRSFEAASGIKVKAVYDVEAAKTTGLANRLVAEMSRPQADVFWSGEAVQTAVLAARGVLAPLPPEIEGAGDSRLWVRFGGRARVIVYNRDLVADRRPPESIRDFAEGSWPAEKTVIAYPLFGTSATHASALYAALGEDEAHRFFQALVKRKVRFVDGNSVVRDLVADGRAVFGLTDTDDACAAIARGAPVAIVFPDQGEGEPGTFVIPNTVALVAGGANPHNAAKLVQYLLSAEVREALGEAGWFHVHQGAIATGSPCPLPQLHRTMDVSPAAVAAAHEKAMADLRTMIVR